MDKKYIKFGNPYKLLDYKKNKKKQYSMQLRKKTSNSCTFGVKQNTKNNKASSFKKYTFLIRLSISVRKKVDMYSVHLYIFKYSIFNNLHSSSAGDIYK